MSVPVYVIHYNAPEWCEETVSSLRQSDHPVHITVVNNGGVVSTDVARVVDMATNIGFTGAANWAIADCPEDPFLLITSHDLVVDAATVGRLLSAADEHPDAGILGANVGWRGELHGVDGPIEWRDWTSGSCLLLRRTCLDEIGDFDERLHSYGDDVDLGRRANMAGWRVGRVLDATAEHHGSAIGPARRERLIMANRLLLAYKYGRWAGLVRALVFEAPRHVGYQLKNGLRSPGQLHRTLWLVCNQVAGAGLAFSRLAAFRKDRR